MATAAEVIAEAREWLKTPFSHQQPVKGVGVDCTNFIARVAENSGAVPKAEHFANTYRRREDGATMLRLLRDYMDFVETQDAQPGDVLALCDEGLQRPDIPRHLVLLTEVVPYWKGIHASERGVVEHRLDLRFKRRIHSVWRLRDLDA